MRHFIRTVVVVETFAFSNISRPLPSRNTPLVLYLGYFSPLPPPPLPLFTVDISMH